MTWYDDLCQEYRPPAIRVLCIRSLEGLPRELVEKAKFTSIVPSEYPDGSDSMTVARTASAQSALPDSLGTVLQISVSGGGVPKTPVDQASVTYNGIVGDHQRNRKFHGGPDRALCLWSNEVIQQLQDEGHDVGPGCTGENLTLEGLNWRLLQPGALLEIGDSVTAQITSYTRPCKTNAQWFVHGDFRRIDESRHPGWSRLYARVLTEGAIHVNMSVRLRTVNQ